MSTRERTVAVLLMTLVAGPALLSGCASKGDGGASAAASTAESSSAGSFTTTETSGDDATDAPPFPADAEPDTEAASADASVTVTDIRIGRQSRFDRVVFEVGGTGTPGWDVKYVDAPSSQGSGKPIEVAGKAVLQVTLTGAGYPYDTGKAEFSSSAPVTGSGTKTVTEAVYDATFEGTSVAFVGTTARTPFRVYLLQNPTRVVVEVADPS